MPAEACAKISEALIAGKQDEVCSQLNAALEAGIKPVDVMNQGLVAGMDAVGQRWKAGDMFLPEVIRSAKAMSGAMDILRPKLAEANVKTMGTFVIGTVLRDLHDIGKDLVAMMMEGMGMKVINLGIDLEPDVFVNAVKEHKPEFLGMSALLTTTMPQMGEVINALKEAGIRDQVKIMVGGAPVTEEYAEEIGADMYAANAAAAVDKAKESANAG
jgi:5-methyltetrahydrofolate--homocysteine methyltransferase